MKIRATNSFIVLTKALYVAMIHNRFTPTLQCSLSPTPLCYNICSNRNNIINVIHGNSRNALNSSNNFHIVKVYPLAYKIFDKILLWNSSHLWTITMQKNVSSIMKKKSSLNFAMPFPFPFPVIPGNNNASFPFPKFGNGISIPVPKNWEWNFHSRSRSQ